MTALCYEHGTKFVSDCAGCSQSMAFDRLGNENRMLHDFRCAALSSIAGIYTREGGIPPDDATLTAVVVEDIAQAMLNIARGDK